MRTTLLSLSLLCLSLPLRAQDEPDASTAPAPRALPVVGAQQDAEAAREKLLKAADELDMIQSNSETTKVAVDGMKSDLAQLQTANADLRQQLAALQSAFAKSETDHARERQALLDEVSQLIAAHSAAPPHPAPRHDDDSALTEVHHPHLAPPADPPPAPKPRKGYNHVVESGETLALICDAFRDQGVKVTVAQIRKANGLTSKSTLKTGQKLFIPAPGT